MERVRRAGLFCKVVANESNGGRKSIASRSWPWRQVGMYESCSYYFTYTLHVVIFLYDAHKKNVLKTTKRVLSVNFAWV